MFAGGRNPLLVFLLCIALLALSGLAAAQSPDQSAPAQPPQAQTPPDVPEHIRVSVGVTRGLLIKKVSPKYPKKARKQGIEGVVVLAAKISKDGDITELSVVSGDPLLAQAATDAVKQWKYRPYLFQGRPVEVDTQIQVNFQLSGN